MSTNGMPPGVRRGPNGQFVSSDESEFDDVEQVTGRAAVRTQEGGGSISAGLVIVDFDDIVDRRNEIAHLISARHDFVIKQQNIPGNSEEGDFTAIAKVGTAENGISQGDITQSTSLAGPGDSAVDRTDSMDPVGPPMLVQTQPQTIDALNGVGSGQGGPFRTVWSTGDTVVAAADFDARDEIQAGLTISPGGDNTQVEALAELDYQYVFGLRPSR